MHRKSDFPHFTRGDCSSTMKPKRSKKRNWLTLPWRLLKRYLANSSIHGLKYLVQDGTHWTERIFWLVCCSLSWWGCAQMVASLVNEFETRRVATTVETNSLDWQSLLPSLHFCAQEVPETKNYSSLVWPAGRNLYRLQDINVWGYISELPEPHDAKYFEELSKKGSMKCEELFDSCSWNEKSFNCCEEIVPLWTPVGHCLTFNSIHTEAYDGKKYYRRDGDTGVLSLYIKSTKFFKSIKRFLSFYILDKHDLPSILSSSEKKVISKWTSNEMLIDVGQEPTFNEPDVRGVSMDKRHCRFADETQGLEIYNVYGYDACLAEDMARRMIELCGCVSHIIRRTSTMPACNLEGLRCIASYKAVLTASENVTCLADCEETTFDFFPNAVNARQPPIVHVSLMSGPTLRYRRYIVRSRLDLVVSVGSAVGLFVGAGILSLVEIPYWFIVRGIDDDDEDDNNTESRN